MNELAFENVLEGIVALLFIVVIIYAGFQVFLALPGGLGYSILFLVLGIIIAIGVVVGVLRAIFS